MYLFFDTETTGVPANYRAPTSDLENWPRMVQIAVIMYDEQGKLQAQSDCIIKPSGFIIPEQAAMLHGITTERAEREGQPVEYALDLFASLAQVATTIVAHNIAFDEKILGAEYLRAGRKNVLEGKRRICTMKGTVEFCGLLNDASYSNFKVNKYRYKWPKLQELHEKLFGCYFEEAHNACIDIEITAKCFWKLKEFGVLN